MQWSWRIARIAGIGVYIHFTFLFLLAWVGYSQYESAMRSTHDSAGSMRSALGEIAFVMLVFGIIVLHELGHAMAARRYGIKTKDITLLPIGGVARLERIPESPWQEFVVAIAGPAVNVVLAAGLFLWLQFVQGTIVTHNDLWQFRGALAMKLLSVNVALVVFNALPAFPMDGGRVLRALLAMRLDYVRATQIAAAIGQGVALVFGIFGLLFPPFVMLLFVAPFVWFVAGQEARMAMMRAQLSAMTVRDAMLAELGILSPTDTLREAAEKMFTSFQEDFPVVEEKRVLGVFSKANLLKHLARFDLSTPVSAVLDKELITADVTDTLDAAFTRLNSGEGRALPVLRDGELAGLITLDQIADYLQIHQALERRRRAALAATATAARPGGAPPNTATTAGASPPSPATKEVSASVAPGQPADAPALGHEER